ncbi:hypothetical protein LCGC14_2947940 [marine sediment metagenome]|uniref:Uncharacterized protein n=1 Tax=marine sediment metagenome TaxID=412755 RepID=A0A0F8XFW9_9ZZZZ
MDTKVDNVARKLRRFVSKTARENGVILSQQMFELERYIPEAKSIVAIVEKEVADAPL